MKFIDLYCALQCIAARVEPSPDPDGCKIFVPAGKLSQSSADSLYARVAPGIDMANRVGKAARSLSEALHDSEQQRPNLFEYEGVSAPTPPVCNGEWSRMKSLLLQAMFWGIREKRYCLEHFRKGIAEGEYFLRGPIVRHETDNWLFSNDNVLRPATLGFNSDEFFAFLKAHHIPYSLKAKSTIFYR